MGFQPFNTFLLVAAGAALLLALVSRALQNRFVASEPVFALGAGFLIGPFALDWVRIEDLATDTNALLEQAARLTLSVAIMTATLRVGWPWMRGHRRDLLLILALGLGLMWALSCIVLKLALGMAIWPALLAAAIITPTDPVLAQAVVTSAPAEENAPRDLRRLISTESAANDGLALLIVMIPVLMLTSPPVPLWSEVLRVLLWEILAALVLGAGLGWVAGKVLVRLGGPWATEIGLATVSVTLAFAALAGFRLLGMDGIFGVFGAGTGLTIVVGRDDPARDPEFNHALSRLFHLPLLILLGLALPLDKWATFGWSLALAVVLVLLFRRLPVLLLMKPMLKSVGAWPSAVFAGWFGPIGIAALFYATFAVHRTKSDDYFVIASAVIAGSVIAHGLSDTFGAKLLGRFLPRDSDESRDESRTDSE